MIEKQIKVDFFKIISNTLMSKIGSLYWINSALFDIFIGTSVCKLKTYFWEGSVGICCEPWSGAKGHTVLPSIQIQIGRKEIQSRQKYGD